MKFGAAVSFLSDATDLVANDNNGMTDIFLHDIAFSRVIGRINFDLNGAPRNCARFLVMGPGWLSPVMLPIRFPACGGGRNLFVTNVIIDAFSLPDLGNPP